MFVTKENQPTCRMFVIWTIFTLTERYQIFTGYGRDSVDVSSGESEVSHEQMEDLATGEAQRTPSTKTRMGESTVLLFINSTTTVFKFSIWLSETAVALSPFLYHCIVVLIQNG